jgi:signal transduction histidine kinase
MEVTQEQQGWAQAKGVMMHLVLPTAVHPDTLTVWGDYSQLGRLLTNVIRNAWQYTPPGGQVWVRLKRQGETFTIEVQDTGVGIAETDLPRVFDRFFRVDPARGAGGSGLGLAIAQSIAQAHQGTIHLTSKEGQGTLVVITLPRFKEPTHRG